MLPEAIVPPVPRDIWLRFLKWVQSSEPGSFTFHKSAQKIEAWESKETGRVS